MFTIEKTAFLLYLLALAVIDIRKREMPSALLAAGCAAAALVRALTPGVPPLSVLLGAAVGTVFLLLSKMTREQIGYGDSILILCIGIFSGVLELLEVLFTAFLMSAVFSAAALAVRKFHRNTRYPFVPFLFVAYFAVSALQKAG